MTQAGWGEHLRQHTRVTVEDQAIEARAFAIQQSGGAPVAAHLIATRTYVSRTPAQPPYTELCEQCAERDGRSETIQDSRPMV